MINLDNNLILIKGEDKTNAVSSWKDDSRKNIIWITYNGGKTYPYSSGDVKFFKSPVVIDMNNKLVLKNGVPCSGIVKILKFSSYARLYFKTGYKELVHFSCIKLLDSALDCPDSKNCFGYLKQVANVVGLRTEDGHNILSGRYEKIDFVREDSIMACYLQGKLANNQTANGKTAIFPFGFNISQKCAVDNALNHRMSVIEGPPGTGKTQTILNIIANAVMRGESVAVVSSNNSATANVFEKLQKYGVDFLVASLGSTKNKSHFIENQTANLPNLAGWQVSPAVFSEKSEQLQHDAIELDAMLSLQNEKAVLSTELDHLQKEYTHFRDVSDAINHTPAQMPSFDKRIKASCILEFLSEFLYRIDNNSPLHFFTKLKWCFRYGLKGVRFWRSPIEEVLEYCQHVYYQKRVSEIEARMLVIQMKLNAFNFDEKMAAYTELSKTVFRAKLAEKYKGTPVRKIYDLDELWKDSEKFIRDYPIVLSTTYSLRSSLANHFVYDYVIVDEASQVDVATGALALSCAKKAVIVGDLKQLPNVVKPKDRKITDDVFIHFGLNPAYSYADNSLLSSITKLFADIPRTLLKEHYRCHPEIIGFCNQRFYNNELIIMTQPKSDKKALMVYRTAAGNHARGHYNQRQIDVILHEVIPEQHLNTADDSLGIVTPYREQANHLQTCFAGTGVKADTADKFQGQERKVMIFSTVDNDIGAFASDPNRLNVAVSRAIEQFVVVTDGNDNDTTSPIHDLIGYIQYHNHDLVSSKISSVFDYLYRDYASARKDVLKRYGRITEVESENLMYGVIREVLSAEEFSKYDVVPHVPLRSILRDLSLLTGRELSFASNHLTHVDFLIYSKLSHMPTLVVEVDGFAYHNENEKQKERDAVKNTILEKYKIPIVRFSTVGSNEKNRLIQALRAVCVLGEMAWQKTTK